MFYFGWEKVAWKYEIINGAEREYIEGTYFKLQLENYSLGNSRNVGWLGRKEFGGKVKWDCDAMEFTLRSCFFLQRN